MGRYSSTINLQLHFGPAHLRFPIIMHIPRTTNNIQAIGQYSFRLIFTYSKTLNYSFRSPY